MSRPEAILEELGLSPIWIRRGTDARHDALAAAEAPGAGPVREAAPGPSPGPAAREAAFAATAPESGEHLASGVGLPGNLLDGADALAIATLDWSALEQRALGCTACPLCEKRTQVVFGVGDPGADWLIVGEAPGENEDRVGEPFVGPAGQLLDNMLRAVGLARGKSVYIANVIKCRPPGNRNPTVAEVATCQPYLRRQVELIRPKLIVALGRFAAQALLDTDATIAALRGRVHAYDGVPLVVTYHPAYLLRSLPDKAKAWADLCLARSTFQALGR